MDLKDIIFFLDVYELAKDRQFRIITNGDTIEVFYPNSATNEGVTIKNLKDWAAFCVDVLNTK